MVFVSLRSVLDQSGTGKIQLCRIVFVLMAVIGFSALPSPAHAQDMLSAKAQAALNDGLDAVNAQRWSAAVQSFLDVIATAEDDIYFLSDEKYQKFTDMVPAYVFSNLALASDKYGQSPLRTAMYYRAYLAYDPETDQRRSIERRIRELETEHLKYIYPLCKAAAARMALVGFVVSSAEASAIAWRCIAALVAIDEIGQARKIEKAYREGFFTNYIDSCGDPAFLDAGYAMGYRLVGNDDALAKHLARVNDPRNVPKGSCGNAFDFRANGVKKNLKDSNIRWLNWQTRMEKADWPGGRVAHALDWIDVSRWAENIYNALFLSRTCSAFVQVPEGRFPSPLLDLGGYLALRDYDAIHKVYVGNILDSNRFSSGIAEHNTCAAFWMARYWVIYSRSLLLWEKRVGKQIRPTDRPTGDQPRLHAEPDR